MNDLDYQRTIIGYHGCDAGTARDVLLGDADLEPSQNPYDWLGNGIYFWEHGPQRALDWAGETSRRDSTKIKTPAVLGAFIQLGVCFDLLDTRATELLQDLYPLFVQSLREENLPLPENRPVRHGDNDLVLRYLDCAMLNWSLVFLERNRNVKYQTVRCVFTEGRPAFSGAGIMLKSHIQVTVRDPACILGYFRPARL